MLVLRRSRRSRFAPGFVVFPGGVMDPEDEDVAARRYGDRAEAPRACAVRELREETGLRVDGAALVEVGRWVAPAFLDVRFDARFYAVAVPGGPEPVTDGVEIERAWWAAPDRVLDLSREGGAPLMWPTLVMLERLSACHSVAEVLALRVVQVDPPVTTPVPGGGPRAFRPASRRREASS